MCASSFFIQLRLQCFLQSTTRRSTLINEWWCFGDVSLKVSARLMLSWLLKAAWLYECMSVGLDFFEQDIFSNGPPHVSCMLRCLSWLSMCHCTMRGASQVFASADCTCAALRVELLMLLVKLIVVQLCMIVVLLQLELVVDAQL